MPLVAHVGLALPHFDAVEVPGLMCQPCPQVESVLGQDVTDVVKDCLSLLPNERPIMADIAERVALSLYRHLL